ncbi:MAG TPA: DUF3239 domain-containing protein [Armatimonadota bacterium]|jgi:hypothetical protein
MAQEPQPLTVDSTTVAKNPGGVHVQPLRWLLYYPLWPTIWTTSMLLCIYLAARIHWDFWIPAIVILFIHRLYWAHVRDQYLFGNITPGVVVSLDPLLIAVSADLTKGKGHYPAIKIVQKRLRCAELGTRVATVSLYAPGLDLSHWADFDPQPVAYATTDRATHARVLQSITEKEWQQLTDNLAKVPQPYAPGLYPLDGKTVRVLKQSTEPIN